MMTTASFDQIKLEPVTFNTDRFKLHSYHTDVENLSHVYIYPRRTMFFSFLFLYRAFKQAPCLKTSVRQITPKQQPLKNLAASIKGVTTPLATQWYSMMLLQLWGVPEPVHLICLFAI